MKDELNKIVCEETFAVKELLEALDNQYQCLIKSDAIAMEMCTDEIQNCNKKIAEFEVKRRQLINGESMKKIIDEIGDKELDNNFRSIKKLLQETKLQKDTNELLIKQKLAFTNKMISILNPDRKAKIYNSYGKMGR